MISFPTILLGGGECRLTGEGDRCCLGGVLRRGGERRRRAPREEDRDDPPLGMVLPYCCCCCTQSHHLTPMYSQPLPSTPQPQKDDNTVDTETGSGGQPHDQRQDQLSEAQLATYHESVQRVENNEMQPEETTLHNVATRSLRVCCARVAQPRPALQPFRSC